MSSTPARARSRPRLRFSTSCLSMRWVWGGYLPTLRSISPGRSRPLPIPSRVSVSAAAAAAASPRAFPHQSAACPLRVRRAQPGPPRRNCPGIRGPPPELSSNRPHWRSLERRGCSRSTTRRKARSSTTRKWPWAAALRLRRRGGESRSALLGRGWCSRRAWT